MENNNKLINFKIVQIATEQFAILEESFKSGENTIELTHKIDFGVDKENRRIFVRKIVGFHHADIAPFIKIAVACHFEMAEEAWEVLVLDNKIVIPRDFAVHLAMLTVGTLRGVLHAKTENTPFNQFIFPTFNVLSLITGDVIFE